MVYYILGTYQFGNLLLFRKGETYEISAQEKWKNCNTFGN